jgi:hypothetical protein
MTSSSGPDWTSTVTGVQRLDSGPFGVGAGARIRQPKLLPAVLEVTDLDEENGFTLLTRGLGLEISGGHRVEPSGAANQIEAARPDVVVGKVTLSLEYSGLLGPLAAASIAA